VLLLNFLFMLLVEAAALQQRLEIFDAMYQRESPGNKQRLKH